MATTWNRIGSGLLKGGKNIWVLAKTSVARWWGMDPFRQSAIIAYYAIFSLPALLVVIVSVAGLAFGADAVNGKIIEQIGSVMGPDTAEQVKEMLAKATETKTSVWATIIGIVTVVLGSIGVFVELQKSLNIIWEVEAKPKSGIWGFLRARVFSFGLILSIAFMLIISLVVSTVLTTASDYLQADSSKFLALLFEGINFMISIAAISLLFALMFKYLPDTQIKWKHVWVGGLVTGLLFTLGKTLLAFYFGKADPGSGYGAAGSIILILLWVNYSSMILFLGAEFTHTYADMREGKPLDAKKEDAKEKQGTGEVEVVEEEQKDKEPSYGMLRAVPFVLPVLAVFNYILPFLLPLIAKRVAARYGVAITLRRVSIGLFKPTIAIKDLTVRYGNSLDESYMVFASVSSISLDYARSAFFRKQLQVEAIKIAKPELEVAMGKPKEKAEKEQTKPQSKSTAPSFLPIIVNRLSLEAGRVGYKNPETKPATQIDIEAIDIFAHAKEEGFIENVDYAIELEGKLLDGKVKAGVNLRAGFKKPTFDIKLELANLNLKMLNDFFMAYAGIDIHKGWLDVFSEASVVQNNINGHIKPLISDLEMLGPEDKNKDALSKIKEAAMGLVKESLENQTQEQVATDIPFNGKLDNPNIGIMRAIGAVAFNIFIKALRPNFNTLFEERFEKLIVSKKQEE